MDDMFDVKRRYINEWFRDDDALVDFNDYLVARCESAEQRVAELEAGLHEIRDNAAAPSWDKVVLLIQMSAIKGVCDALLESEETDATE